MIGGFSRLNISCGGCAGLGGSRRPEGSRAFRLVTKPNRLPSIPCAVRISLALTIQACLSTDLGILAWSDRSKVDMTSVLKDRAFPKARRFACLLSHDIALEASGADSNP